MLTGSGTDTCSGAGSAGDVVARVLVAGGTGGDCSPRLAVEPVWISDDDVVGATVELVGVEDRTERMCTVFCESLTAGASFAAVAGVDTVCAGVVCSCNAGTTPSVAVVATAAAATASLTGAAPPLKNQPKTSAIGVSPSIWDIRAISRVACAGPTESARSPPYC